MEKLWFELPVVPPFTPHDNVVVHVGPPAVHDGGDGGGTRGEQVEPRLLLWERGSRSFKLSLVFPLFNKPDPRQHVMYTPSDASLQAQLSLDGWEVDLHTIL